MDIILNVTRKKYVVLLIVLFAVVFVWRASIDGNFIRNSLGESTGTSEVSARQLPASDGQDLSVARNPVVPRDSKLSWTEIQREADRLSAERGYLVVAGDFPQYWTHNSETLQAVADSGDAIAQQAFAQRRAFYVSLE